VYVRFVVAKRDEDSLEPQGIFQAAAELSRTGRFAAHEEALYQEARAWFSSHLEQPERFARARRPSAKRAISWFKADAREHIDWARQLVNLLEQHDVAVRMLTTDRPGYVVYEDAFQVTAEPFHHDR
jgi:hypothetical protein